MVTDTLPSMQKFIDQEEKREEHEAKLDAKQSEEGTTALRQLFQDFEDQMEREIMDLDDHISVSSTQVEEHRPEQDSLPEKHEHPDLRGSTQSHNMGVVSIRHMLNIPKGRQPAVFHMNADQVLSQQSLLARKAVPKGHLRRLE